MGPVLINWERTHFLIRSEATNKKFPSRLLFLKGVNDTIKHLSPLLCLLLSFLLSYSRFSLSFSVTHLKIKVVAVHAFILKNLFFHFSPFHILVLLFQCGSLSHYFSQLQNKNGYFGQLCFPFERCAFLFLFPFFSCLMSLSF